MAEPRTGAAEVNRPLAMGLTTALSELVAILPKLAEALERQAKPAPPAVPLDGRLTLRLDELAQVLGVSRRVLERERAAGRLPKPDLTIGRRMPLYRIETIRDWLAQQQAQGRRVKP
jgi:hypothetical protein